MPGSLDHELRREGGGFVKRGCDHHAFGDAFARA